MIPHPLHPSVVHFPIVFSVFLPLIAAVVLWKIHDSGRVRSWRLVVLAVALLVASGLVAKETGKDEEDTVEAVVPASTVHDHEEAAETFVLVSWVVLAVSLVGFAPGVVGKSGRLLVLAGAVTLAWLGWRVGDLGGALVYQHGAASAYTADTAGTAAEEEDDR